VSFPSGAALETKIEPAGWAPRHIRIRKGAIDAHVLSARQPLEIRKKEILICHAAPYFLNHSSSRFQPS
jgi:hypothetical protein